MATKQAFLLAFMSVLLGYLWARAADGQSIYCPWEMVITSSAKRIARAAGPGLDQLIVLRVMGSFAGFPEFFVSVLSCTGGKRCSGIGTSGWWVPSHASTH